MINIDQLISETLFDLGYGRHHTMQLHGKPSPYRAILVCQVCGATATVTTNPAPNEADVMGAAAGENCDVIYIRDDNGHAWYFGGREVRQVIAELDGGVKSFPALSWAQAIRILNQEGYITGYDEPSIYDKE